ncbi:MAG: cbb3-type cytochrome c oxidase subunit I [Rubellimicrobium sp.]|nr:cbb3-type cytochrome c oxidase subunit I [Rubellimicrobium sp.]
MTTESAMEKAGNRALGPDRAGRIWIAANLATTGIVLLLMMLFGVLMRMAQGGWITLYPDLFYQFLTVHGTGMVGIAALGGISVMWYFAARHLRLHSAVLGANFVLFLIGVVMILGGVFVGQFSGAWTFLYPLPAVSGGAWGVQGAFWFLFGLLVVGVGLLVVCLEIGRGLIATHGGIARALGWPYLFGMAGAVAPPPVVVATAMSVLVTTLALIGGAIILVLSIVNLLVPSFVLDPLFAKNVIYFFGHTIINATIYMAVTAVYALLPDYTGRPWKTSRPFLAAWMGSTLMVLVIFPHHLLMDFAMPTWTMVFAQVLSYTNSFPVLIVTGLGALAIVHRSGIRWDMASGLLFLSMFGWMAGVVPAVIDATIVINSVMHNTLWVPGHFHFYLLLGLLPMLMGFMYWITRARDSDRPDLPDRSDRWIAAIYAASGLGFVTMFLYSGAQSVPRRWAEHLAEWMAWDRTASVFALLVLGAATWFVLRFLMRLPRFLAAD